MNGKLNYHMAQDIIPSPKSGKVYLYRSMSPNKGYVNNSTVERFMTGLAMEIPDGVTVELSPVYELEERGLYLRKQIFIGPKTVENLIVSIHNLGNSTVKIDDMAALAHIDSYKTRPGVPWSEWKEEEVVDPNKAAA
jgi:hypothetical protein